MNTANLVGQPIFSQLLRLISRNSVMSIARKHNADRYYKTLSTFKHLTSMLYGVLSRCNSLREICDGMLACEGKLNHLGIDKAPARSTLSDANRERKSVVFESLYYDLLKRFQSFLSDSRFLVGLSIKQLFIIDSTTIRLFSDILKGVGRNPKHQGKKKGGVKVHMLIEAAEGIASFLRITAAAVHDHNFLKHIRLPKFSVIVFDKAYNNYRQFALWTKQEIYFVTRIKDNAVYTVVKEIFSAEPPTMGKSKVTGEQHIELLYKEGKTEKKLLLRKITFIDEKGRVYEFICNNFAISTEDIALIYKYRWGIELLFKKMKQNFQLHYFLGETENAIRIQIWCTLIAQLLLTVIQKQINVKRAFSNIVTLVRLHLLSYVDLRGLLNNARLAWKRANPPPVLPDLFGT